MKLAVDTHHLLLEHAGTKRVTVNLIEQFKKTPGVNLLLLSPTYSLKRGTGIIGKLAGHFIRFFWVHIHLPLLCRNKKVEVLLSPEFNTPLYTSCKRAVIAHDAHMRAQRKYTSSLWFYFYYIPFIESAIRRADLIFTVSQFSKNQIVELMRLDESKVVVAYNGVDKSFFLDGETEGGEYRLPAGLIRGKYILFVGTFESRKNIERLIAAFVAVKKHPLAGELKLAIAGNSASSKFSDRSQQIDNLIAELGLTQEVVLCGFVPDAELPMLYRQACLVAFPSLHEGFGLPIIEGFASEVPVLTSNVCSMPEIAGNAALIADPYNTTDIAEKLEQLIFDPILRRQLIAEGVERVKEFTWDRCAKQIVNHLKMLA
ncbi:glycosyltransferase family 4 protein [Flavihumibacter sp. R14]|nr:glycosyltransferase family 4 protein [Flavihumibacter soli]